VRDLFFESIALQRIEMVTRLVAMGRCESEDKELALDWVAELSADLLKKLNVHEAKNFDGYNS